MSRRMVNEALPTDVLAPGVLPPGLRIYAIGDVHGCADRLGALHAQIAADARARPAEEVVLVHLGDYVDRGDGQRRRAGAAARAPARSRAPRW